MAVKDKFEKFRDQIDKLIIKTLKSAELPAPIKEIIKKHPAHEAWRVSLSIPEPTIVSYKDCSNCAGGQQFFVRVLEGNKLESPGSVKRSFYEPHKAWYKSSLFVYPCPVCSPDVLDKMQAASSGLSANEWSKSMAKDFLPMPGKEDLRVLGLNILADRYPSGWITLHGGYGVGKTHWMQCLVADFIRQGVVAKYIPMVQILSEVTGTFDQKNKTVDDVVGAYVDIRILAIDEVDRVPKGSWHMAEFFKFLDIRYRGSVNDQEQLTILALNEDLGRSSPEFEQLFGYLKSRMTGGLIVKVGGDDLRPLAGDEMKQKYLENQND